MISVLVPNSFCPRGRTLTLASAAQRALFHIAVAHPGVEDDFLQARQIFVSLIGRGDVWLADDLDQGHAGAVQVDGGLLVGIGEALVQALAGVFFEMYACDADLLCLAAVNGDFDESEFGEGLVVLRDLVALREVRIEIVLAGKDRGLVDAAVQGHRGQCRELHNSLVENGQRARHAEADGADVRIRAARRISWSTNRKSWSPSGAEHGLQAL